jgi:alpha-galactosidase/6-phospho-beta-glucosidase family protein
MKQYERTLIHASLEGSRRIAQLALTQNPLIGDWEIAGGLLESLIAASPENLGYLR